MFPPTGINKTIPIMPQKLQLQSVAKATNYNFDIEKAKGRPMLQWVGKRPLDKVEYYPAQEKEIYGDKNSKDFNKLFWGDNLQVLAHLLKEYRGKIDLIYIDPPFDSKAEYVKKVQIRGEKVEGEQHSLLEEKQYTDIWERDEYLQFMYERLLLMRELLSDTGSIYLHCDWHKGAFLRLIMDEVFGEENFLNEIIWNYVSGGISDRFFARKHDNLLLYAKSANLKYTFNVQKERKKAVAKEKILRDAKGEFVWYIRPNTNPKVPQGVKSYLDKFVQDVWQIPIENPQAETRSDYPTQKSEALLERIIKASSNDGDLVADFFVGSGTTPAVAQKLGRRWIACDINLGAIQTTTKRLNQIIEEQQKKKDKNFRGLHAFKVLNVNDYDVFKNEIEAKEIVMEMYGVEPIKRSYFDGVLDNNFVKVMPLNRVLNKMDIRATLKEIEKNISTFSVKKKSKTSEPVYEEGVLIIASGVELDVSDFLKKENKTGVRVEIRDILTDKKNLIFKKKPEAKIEVKTKDKKLSVKLKEFYSPILMRKLELENGKVLKKDRQAKVADFKQIIDSVAIDVDYNGKLFNAEVMDLPTKKELIKAKYSWEYPKKGKYIVAVKVVDVLGEEYFETFEIQVK
jgi:adenine-specific DNA-methyltransferase